MLTSILTVAAGCIILLAVFYAIHNISEKGVKPVESPPVGDAGHPYRTAAEVKEIGGVSSNAETTPTIEEQLVSIFEDKKKDIAERNKKLQEKRAEETTRIFWPAMLYRLKTRASGGVNFDILEEAVKKVASETKISPCHTTLDGLMSTNNLKTKWSKIGCRTIVEKIVYWGEEPDDVYVVDF